MTTWSEAAKHELEQYLERIRSQLEETEADAEEVVADLRRHVEQEIDQLDLPVVSADDVRRVTQKSGMPEKDTPVTSPQSKTSAGGTKPKHTWRRFRAGNLFFWSILLPAITVGYEIVTGACADLFFDPIPTWWHAGILVFAIGANGMAWFTLRKDHRRVGKLHGIAIGFALIVSLYYAILFLPVAPISLVGLVATIYFGIGLLALMPLSPLFAWIAVLPWRRIGMT